jgi:peptidoglycan/xylan/chitin deacetylase (PgdA/CDA1 family)
LNHRIPILLYHRIEDSAVSTATAPSVFRQQLASLKEQGWRSLSSDELAFTLKSGRSLPERAFMITFDDGYETVRTVALDILREFDFKAISFLSTKLMRGSEGTAGDVKAEEQDEENRDAYLTWDQARELQESGLVDCQSHSHTHNNFSEYTLDAITRDLDKSVDLLSQQLRLPRAHFRHLAWPWGLSRPEWRDAASRAGFVYQYGVSRQAVRLPCPLDQVPRTCFDASTFAQFQRQLWLQTGQLSQAWEIAYPFGRKLRHIANFARG